MFNVGGPEIVVIILVALVVLGPDQLPKALRTFGNVMGEIRKISGGFQAEMRSAMDTFTDDTPAARRDKPQSGTMASPTPSLPAESMEQADVTEVVARNTGPVDAPPVEGVTAPRADATDAPVAEPAPLSGERPAIDPADRAAG